MIEEISFVKKDWFSFFGCFALFSRDYSLESIACYMHAGNYETVLNSQEGETPMHLAAELTRDRTHFNEEDLQIVSLLLSYGGDINFCTKLTQVICFEM